MVPQQDEEEAEDDVDQEMLVEEEDDEQLPEPQTGYNDNAYAFVEDHLDEQSNEAPVDDKYSNQEYQGDDGEEAVEDEVAD